MIITIMIIIIYRSYKILHGVRQRDKLSTTRFNKFMEKL